MSPKRRRSTRGTGRAVVPRASGSHSSAVAAQGAQRVSAAVVLFFIFASTAIAIHDLYLVIKLF